MPIHPSSSQDPSVPCLCSPGQVSHLLSVLLSEVVILFMGCWGYVGHVVCMGCWNQGSLVYVLVAFSSSQMSWPIDVYGVTSIYSCVLHLVGYYWCDSVRVCSEGYTGAFVHVANASPCPGFNRGKNAPGGGRGSRSPTWHILIELISIFDFTQETVVYKAYSSYKRIVKYSSSEKKDDQVYQTIGQAGKKYIV